MKFHVLSVLTYYGNTDQIDAFHARMFHGEASRGGERPTSQDARLAYEVDRPLCLHKNVYNIAPVFAPEFALVVCANVKSKLGDVPQVRFAPVRHGTLFSFPYGAGDFSFLEEMPDYITQQEFIDNQKDDPQRHLDVGEFSELIAPPIREIRNRYAKLRDISVEIGPTEFDEPLEFPISAAMLEDFPIFKCGSFIIHDNVFSRLAEFIDWTYFTHVQGTF